MDNVEECTKAISVLNVIGPIAQQIVELKQREGTICDASTILQLLKQCELLKTSTLHLLNQIECQANKLNDKHLSNDVTHITAQMADIVQGMSDSTRDLHRDSEVCVRDLAEVWDELIILAEDFLGTLVNALLSWDRAQVRQINFAFDHFLTSLNVIKSVQSIKQLPHEFENVVSACSKVLSKIGSRCGDICRRPQREMLHITSLQLHHALSILAGVVTTTTFHPTSRTSKTSDGVFGYVEDLVCKLRTEVSLGSDEYNLQEGATFTTAVDEVFNRIRNKLSISGGPEEADFVNCVKCPLESVLKHSIGVAQSCDPADYMLIMNASHLVLNKMKAILMLENQHETPQRIEWEVALETLGDSIEFLEQKVNTSLIRIIVQTLAEPRSILEELIYCVKCNMHSSRQSNANQYKCSDEKLKLLVTKLDRHIEQLCQLGGLTIACTSDVKKVRLINSYLFTLEWLESILVPSIINAYNKRQPHLLTYSEVLVKHWVKIVMDLRHILYQLMEPSAFSLVTKHEIHKLWAQLRDPSGIHDRETINLQLESVKSLTLRILSLDDVDKFLTATQKNQFVAAVAEFQLSHDMWNQTNNTEQYKSLIKRVQLILTLTNRLSNLLNEDVMEDIDFEVDVQGHTSPISGEKMSESEKKAMLTSKIEDIPVDISIVQVGKSNGFINSNSQVCFSNSGRRALASINGSGTALAASKLNLENPQHKQIKSDWNRPARSKLETNLVNNFPQIGNNTEGTLTFTNHTKRLVKIRSTIRLGDVNGRNKTGENEEMSSTGGISIDISKFLSRSNTLRGSSLRGSKRNFSLKVKEIDLDIGEILNPGAVIKRKNRPSNLSHNGDKFEMRDNVNNSVRANYGHSDNEISEMIENEKTRSQDTHLESFEDDLSGLLAGITSVVDHFSTSNLFKANGKKDGWLNFSSEDNLRESLLEEDPFKNISPTKEQLSNVSFGDMKENVPLFSNDSANESTAKWKDFTAILETKTPAKPLNFTNNFTPKTSSINCGPLQQFKTLIQISDNKPNTAQMTMQNNSEFLSSGRGSESVQFGQGEIPDESVDSYQRVGMLEPSSIVESMASTPSSFGIETPQRIGDLQVVHKRLASLRLQRL